MKTEDRSILVIMHLSALMTGFVGPLIFWLTQKDKIVGMDVHGKAALNFQITVFFSFIVVICLTMFCCIGALLVPIWIVLIFIFPVISAVRAGSGKSPYYPFNIKFIV